LSVEVTPHPSKAHQDLYRVHEGTKLIVAGGKGRIIVLPVQTYDRPTEAVYGSVNAEAPVDEPKQAAREHIRRKLCKELG
jgi:hypothetical protein